MVLGDARQGRFAENLVGFSRTLRRAGIPVDIARIGLAQRALTLVDLGSRDDVKSALETVLVSRQQDLEVFSHLFDAFFKDPEIAKQLLAQLLPQSKAARSPVDRNLRAQEALYAIQQNQPDRRQTREEEIQLDAAMSASASEQLRNADFESLSASEFLLVERLAREIPLPLPHIRSRRHQPSSHGTRIDWPALLAQAARHAGEFADIAWSCRRPDPLPLLILVDVSGSMQRYARLLLAFLHQATRKTKRSVFAFGTRLTDLNASFALEDTDAMLTSMNRNVPDFGGGTRIGTAIQTLREQHRNAIIGNRTIVLLISDGLDTGDKASLDREVSWLCRQARATVWLNPLLRYEGYQPLAGGASVLSRHVDQMLAIHNLAHLQSLATALASLMQKARKRA